MPTRPSPVSLQKLAVENKKLALENKKLKSSVDTLKTENKTVKSRLTSKERELASKTGLKRNPHVIELLKEGKAKFTVEIEKKNTLIKNLQRDLLTLKGRYAHLDKIKPVEKAEFNRFLSNSIIDLQSELSSANGEYEFIVRDLEVEVNLLVESRATKLVYILPTTTQLNEIEQDKMHKLKFSLSVAPKE